MFERLFNDRNYERTRKVEKWMKPLGGIGQGFGKLLLCGAAFYGLKSAKRKFEREERGDYREKRRYYR